MSDAFAKNKKRKNGVTDFFNFFFFLTGQIEQIKN